MRRRLIFSVFHHALLSHSKFSQNAQGEFSVSAVLGVRCVPIIPELIPLIRLFFRRGRVTFPIVDHLL